MRNLVCGTYTRDTYIPRKKRNSPWSSSGVAFQETQDKLRLYADAMERALKEANRFPGKEGK